MNAPATIGALTLGAADLADPRVVARLDGYVRAHPEGGLYHRPQWSLAVERGCGQRAHYLVAERAGQVLGCLPLTEVRSRLFGHAMVSAGFGTGGGIIADGADIAGRLAEAGWALAERRGCASLELRGGPLPPGWTARTGVYSNFSRPLPGDDDALRASIPRRQRSEIRKAQDFGLDVEIGAGAALRSRHYRVYAASVRNLGTPVFPRRLFEAALDAFGDEAEIVLVSRNGEPLSSMLCFVAGGIMQPVWGGGTAAARSWRANDLAYFEVMRRGVARGCAIADFGRSKVGTGPWSRKRIWGFEETPLVYGVRTADGHRARETNPLDPKYRFKVAAWQRLPLAIANRLGPLIARGLG